MDKRSDCRPTTTDIGLDFDEVEPGATKIMSIKIVNQSEDKQSYFLQQDPDSNTLDNVFHTLEYSWSLEPGESYVCDISFRPLVPKRKYTEYFLILDTYNCCYRVTLRGNCSGPKVTACSDRLIINKNDNSRATKCFKLTNSSDVSAKFMFDIDNEQGPFKVSEKSGIVKAYSTKVISVAFEPTGYGIYMYYLNCLVLHQDPIIIELFGLGSEKKTTEDIILKIEEVEKMNVTDGFRNYMRDVTSSVKSYPPCISLTSNFIDFGQAEIGPENFTKRTPQTISLTNHYQFDIFVVWDKDASNAFGIQPQEAKMRGQHTCLFEVRFDPNEDQTFYSRELMARIFRLPCCAENFKNPIPLLMNFIPRDFVCVRLIGHTYKRALNDWIPQYEITEAVIMPACLPAMPTYTTFFIRNFGFQPLMFCFVPPDVSHFDVKPMMGLISPQQEYQLITVQLFSEAEDSRAYVERWAIRLNGSNQNIIYVDFQGFAEQPCLVFGDDNIVSLNPIYVGSKRSQPVPVRNKTRHSVHYDYIQATFPKMFSISQMRGVISPNESVIHDWTLIPEEIQDYNFDISCNLSTELGGRCFPAKVEVTAKSTKGFLMAVPDELNFGMSQYNVSQELEFKIFNFSQVVIDFLLICRSTKNLEILNNPEKDVKLCPGFGSICPGKSEKIKVIIVPSEPGFYELTIDYYIRPNAGSKKPRTDIEPQSICSISCCCSLPTIQVEDLMYLSETNKYVSKHILWKSLKINTLNSAANNLLPMQETSIEMTLPFTRMHDNEKFIVKLLLANTQYIDATWSIKKKRICHCCKGDNKIKMRKSSKKECLFCIKDKACNIFPQDVCIPPNESEILTIEVSGRTLEPSGICWKLDMGLGRKVLLNIRLQSPIIASGPLLKFHIDFIGNYTTTRHQAIWLYNNTEFRSAYEIDTKNLATLNKENFGPIFTCLNPTGFVDGFSRKPIFFGFNPNKFGKYETTVKVRLDEEVSILKIEAEAMCTLPHNEIELESCPLYDTFRCPEIYNYFNVDYIVFPTLTTHGKTSKLFMLHNHNMLDVYYFEWRCYEIPGFITVSLQPDRGLIQPHTLLTFLLEIEAGFFECALEIDLYCNFLNVSERSKLERKNRQIEDVIEKAKDEFTITEEGLTTPENPQIDRSLKPSTICKTLTLKINVLNRQSTNLKIDVTDQFKLRPSVEIGRRTARPQDDFPLQMYKMTSDILECILWEILQSKTFADILTKLLSGPHHLKYSQLLIDLDKRDYETERCKAHPTKRVIEGLMRAMIINIVHSEFNLDVIHFGFAKDVRTRSFRRLQLNTEAKRHMRPENIRIL